jgi:hypothetical protein
MKVNPRTLVFENVDDVIDFASLGAIPTRNQMCDLARMIYDQSMDKPDNIIDIGPDGSVIKNMTIDFADSSISPEELIDIMTRIRENRVKNVKSAIPIAAAVVAGAFLLGRVTA